MSGQQRQREREVAGSKRKEFNAATRLAGERQKYRDREREGGNGTEVLRCSADRLAFRRQRGAVRRPAGARQHSAVFNQDQKKLDNRVKSCSYTNIRGNKSLRKSHRRPKQETH